MQTIGEYYQRHHHGTTGKERYGTTVEGQDRIDWFAERIGRDMHVLDLGCRDGSLTCGFANHNRVVGVDVDETALATARQKLGIETLMLDINREALPMADGSFDVVVAGEVIEHLQFPDLVTQELLRVLKPGGVFLGSVPNAFRLRNRLLFLKGEDFEQDPTHLHHFNEAALRKLLEPHGAVTFDYLGGKRIRRLHSRFEESPAVARLFATVLLWECRKFRQLA